jgi:hypothetical protein
VDDLARILQASEALPECPVPQAGPLPRGWIVERTFAWLGRYRRHSKDYERNPATSEAMIYVAMIRNILRRLERARGLFTDTH